MNADPEKNSILSQQVISRKLRRMALEIAESNAEEKELIIAAINGNGEIVAGQLTQELQRLTHFECISAVIRMNKKDPMEISFDAGINIENKVVLIVDDVANTGKTMLYALKPFLNKKPKKIQTVALVERSHKLFPIQTDFAGLSLATTMQEYIEVRTEDGAIAGAWLLQR